MRQTRYALLTIALWLLAFGAARADIVLTGPGTFTQDEKKIDAFIGVKNLDIINNSDQALTITSLTLNSGAWLSSWSLVILYPSGSSQVVPSKEYPWQMGERVPFDRVVTLEPGERLRIQVNNASAFKTKFSAKAVVK